MKKSFLKKRLKAGLIDFTPYFIILIILIISSLFLDGSGLSNSGPSKTSTMIYYFSLLLTIIIFMIQTFFYFKDGQTLGYKLVKLKIVSIKEDEKKIIVYRNLFFRFWLKYGSVLFGLCFLFPLCIIYFLIELYFVFIKKDDLYDRFTGLKIVLLESDKENQKNIG